MKHIPHLFFPILGVGLNSVQTTISDHKPVAAKKKF